MRQEILFVAALLLAPTTANARISAPDPGPAPTMEQFRAVAEAAVKPILADASSAQFKWTSSHRKVWRGYQACGMVDSASSTGSRTGFKYFRVTQAHGAVAVLEQDQASIQEDCAQQQYGEPTPAAAAPAEAPAAPTESE